MDLRLAILVLGSLQLQRSAANDPFWNLFNQAIEVSDGYGDINATKDAERLNSNSLQWNFAIEIGQGQMIRLKFLLQGNYDMLTLDIDGTETFVATGVSCYYFTRSGQTDSQCELTATQSGCGFVNLTTTHLNLFYNGVVRPQLIFEYVYMDCSGHSLFSAQTSQPIPPSLGRSLVIDNPGIPFDLVTVESGTKTKKTQIPTLKTNLSAGPRNIGVPEPNLPTGNILMSGETTQPSATSDSVDTMGPSGGNNLNLIVIIVVVVAVVIIILSALGWRCFKRKQSKSTSQSTITSSIPATSATDRHETTHEVATPSTEPHTAIGDRKAGNADYITPDVFPDEGDYEEPDRCTLLSQQRLAETPGYQTVAALPGDYARYAAYDVTNASETNTYANAAPAVTPHSNGDHGERNSAFSDGLMTLQESFGYQTVEMLPGDRVAYSDYGNTGNQQNLVYESIS